jgi:hypothetical protein
MLCTGFIPGRLVREWSGCVPHGPRQFFDPQILKNAEFLKKEYLDKGWLGAKSGRGFYAYPDPEYLAPDFRRGKES